MVCKKESKVVGNGEALIGSVIIEIIIICFIT